MKGTLRSVSGLVSALVLALAGFVGGGLVFAVPAGASPLTWSVPTPVAVWTGTPSLSCPSSTVCVVVAGTTYQTVTNREWSDPVMVPGASALTGVSCTAATACVAVDDSGNVLTYTSGSWSVPNHVDVASGFNDVSCASSAFCMAVDSAGTAFVESSGTWSSQSVDLGHVLVAVSCGSATFCVAVDDNGTEFTYNAGAWTFRQVDSTREFTAIDCVSASFCVAGDNTGRAVLFSNGSWTPVFFVAARAVESITCVSASYCVSGDIDGGVEEYTGGFNIGQPEYVDQNGAVLALGCYDASLCIGLSGSTAIYGHNPTTTPSTPTHVSTAALDDGIAQVLFTPAADDGASGPVTYTATCVSGDGGATVTVSGGNSPLQSDGFTDGATYACTVAGANGAGTGPSSLSSNDELIGVPGRPAVLSVTAGNGLVTVAYQGSSTDGGSPATSFTLTCTSSDGGATGSTTGTSSPLDVTGLTNGKTYTCNAVETNAVGDSLAGPSSSAVVPLAVPGAPTNVAVVGDGSGIGLVSFAAPADDGGSPITQYVATCTSSDGGATATASFVRSEITVSGLTNTNTYRCTIAATNGAGTGPDSAPSLAIVIGGPSAPHMGVVTPGNGSVTFGFTAPSDTGAGPITGYTVTCPSYDGGATGTATGTTSPIVVSGLTNGNGYTCNIVASNAVASGDAAGTINYTIGAPGTPNSASATTHPGSVTVAFTAPSDPGASPVTGYQVTCFDEGGDQDVSATGTSSPITLTGFNNDDSYGCVVYAINAFGLSKFTDVHDGVFPHAAPSVLRNVSVTRQNGAIAISFDPPADDGGHIGLVYSADCTSSNGGVAVSHTSLESPNIVPGVTNGKTYTCSISAKGISDPGGDGFGAAATTNAIVPAGPPLAPASAAASASSSSATVTWTAAPANGAAVTSYVVQPFIGAAAQTGTIFASTATSHVITGLTNGKTYTFKVSAMNAMGNGAQTTTAAVVVGAPAPPAGVTATTGATTGTLVVSFTIGANNGNAITGQTATCASSDGGVTKTGTHSGATGAPITVAVLTIGKTYACTVTATNGNGTGAASAPSVSIVVVGPPAPPTAVVAQSGSTVTLTGSLVASFTIGANNGSAITSQTATCTSSNGGVTKTGMHAGATAAPITVAVLTTGKSYTCTVTATNAEGTGAASAASPAVILGSPAPPTAVVAKSASTTTTTGSAVVTFTIGANNGSVIIRQTASCLSSNGGVTKTGTHTGPTAAAITVAALTTGKTYMCTVTATNARGVGTGSVASVPVIVGSPAPPTAVTAVHVASGQIKVSFTIGANNGSAITSQTATCTSSNGGVTKTGTHTGPTGAPITVTGLTPAKTYTCTVLATNARGPGLASAPSTSVTA